MHTADAYADLASRSERSERSAAGMAWLTMDD